MSLPFKNYEQAGVGPDVQFGKQGARFVNVGTNGSAVLEAHVDAAGGGGLTQVRVANPLQDNDAATKLYVDNHTPMTVGVPINGGTALVNPATGAAYNEGDIGIVITSGTTASSAPNGGGSVTYAVDEIYYFRGLTPSGGSSGWSPINLFDGMIVVFGNNIYSTYNPVSPFNGTGVVKYPAFYRYEWNVEAPSANTWISMGIDLALSGTMKTLRGSVDFSTTTGTYNIGASLPTNAHVLKVFVNVSTLFNGTAPALTIDSPVGNLMTNTDMDITLVNLYLADVYQNLSAGGQVTYTFTQATGGPTTGHADIEVVYSLP